MRVYWGLSRHIGDGRIYAFEPVPFTHRTLRQVARLLRFRNVEIIPKGCSDKAGEITFRQKGLTHIEEGISDQPLRAVFVELKEGRSSGETPASSTLGPG